jgi:hypothetical protein
MSIQLTKPVVRKRLNGSQWQEEQWVATCDYGRDDDRCNAQSGKAGANAGEAAVNAKREGFITINVGATRPMQWRCPKCAKRVLCRKLPSNVARK